MQKETKNWLNMVDYDIKTAEGMLRTGRYVYVISNRESPKLVSSYSKEVAERYLKKTLEVIRCIKQDPRLKK